MPWDGGTPRCRSSPFPSVFPPVTPQKILCGSGGIQTHIPAGTGDLIHCLRPLSHATPLLPLFFPPHHVQTPSTLQPAKPHCPPPNGIPPPQSPSFSIPMEFHHPNGITSSQTPLPSTQWGPTIPNTIILHHSGVQSSQTPLTSIPVEFHYLKCHYPPSQQGLIIPNSIIPHPMAIYHPKSHQFLPTRTPPSQRSPITPIPIALQPMELNPPRKDQSSLDFVWKAIKLWASNGDTAELCGEGAVSSSGCLVLVHAGVLHEHHPKPSHPPLR